MYNWSTDTVKLQKNPHAYAIWKLEQLINFGLNGERINRADLRAYWSELDIDPDRKHFLELLLN